MSRKGLAQAAEWTAAEVRNAFTIATHAATAVAPLDEAAAAEFAQLADALPRTGATIVLCGEYKRGKSSVLNAMLATRVCPTNPLTSCAVPVWVRYGPEPRFAVRVLQEIDGQERHLEKVVDADEYDRLLAPAVPVVGEHRIDHAEVQLPHPLLRQGLVFVDTPSISGGLMSPAASAVLSAAAGADAILFVTDASQELTAPEIEFLQIARSLASRLLVGMTKIDLYPQWRRLVDIDHDHLQTALGTEPVILPVSPALRRAAVRHGDDDIDRESGVGVLAWYLVANVLSEVRQEAIAELGRRVESRLGAVEEMIQGTLDALSNTEHRAKMEAEFAELDDKLRRLGSNWQNTLNTLLIDYQTAINEDREQRFHLVRKLAAELPDSLDPQTEWDHMVSEINAAGARAYSAHFGIVRDRSRQVVDDLASAMALQYGELHVDLDEVAEVPLRPDDIDHPDFAQDKVMSGFNTVRTAGITASGVGTAGGLVAGPIVGSALVAGIATGGLALVAGAAIGFLVHKKSDAAALESNRAKAERELTAQASQMERATARRSDNIRRKLEALIRASIETSIKRIASTSAAQMKQLQIQLEAARQHRPDEERRLEEQLEHVRLIRAHARRLDHRLDRPQMEIPVR